MASDQEAIETFMSITGVDEATAILKLEEHKGSLDEAVNAHFNEGDRNPTQLESFTPSGGEYMDIEDPVPFEFHRRHPLPFGRELNPFALLDPNFTRRIFNRGNGSNRSPFVSHPREVREIPIEVNDTGDTGHSVGAPIIEEITGSVYDHGPEVRGTVIIDEDDDISLPNSQTTRAIGHWSRFNFRNSEPSAPVIVDEPEYGNDIEEEMVRAAIEASKQEAEISNQSPAPELLQSHPEDADLSHAVSLSLQTAEQEKAFREQEGMIRPSAISQISGASNEIGRLSTIGRQSEVEVGSTTRLDEAEDVEDLPLVRRRRRHLSSAPIGIDECIGEFDHSQPSISPPENNVHHRQQNGNNFPSVWGDISSEEHDEAVMLEAAMFGGVPDGGGYHVPRASHHLIQNDMGPYLRHLPRPPSPSLTSQRMIREQQDDEFLTSLEADREKELKAKDEADAALVEERLREEALHRKFQEEKEYERHLLAKNTSLPQEPAPDDVNAVTLLVRMPDGSRRGRRFLKSDKLQSLFDFIDVGRVVKPGSYRLVRPYPRRAFGDGESWSTLDELGLTSKQEALFLELT